MIRSNYKYALIINIFLITVIFTQVKLDDSGSLLEELKAETVEDNYDRIAELANNILSDRRCPCPCGNYLPGSSKSPACFGCSVGKAEITHVLESLEAGKTLRDVTLDLMSPVLIEVFSDYTNKNLSYVWKQVKDVSNELHQSRIVLRTPGLTLEDRRAIKLAECARINGEFSIFQDILIDHSGPWNWNTLFDLATQNSYDYSQIEYCLYLVDIDAQIAKDRQHAKERTIKTFPTITINSKVVQNTKQAIRQAIEDVISEKSI